MKNEEPKIILTRALLHAASSSGYNGFTKAQVNVMNIAWPPKKGWLSALVGKSVRASIYQRFVDAGKIKAKS